MTSETSAAQPATYLRALGPRERCLYRYSERNPLLFVLVAEFDIALDAHLVGDALYAVQWRHPLLSAHIKDDPATGPGFYQTNPVAPIDLTFHRDSAREWEVFAAEELARPFDRAVAPLMRATLLTQGKRSTLLLAFDHAISDGISSVSVLNDLCALLNGESLTTLRLPRSLEDMATRNLGATAPGNALPSPDLDATGMGAPTFIRPFDATPPYVHRVAMGHDATTRLIERCREERTTVHAAIVTAASRVRSTQCGEAFVRTYTPINVRDLVAQGPGCCLCISFATTGVRPADGTAFWDQARETSNRLTAMRSAGGLMIGSAVLESHFPINGDCDAAEYFLRNFLPFELAITNLGVQDLPYRPVRPRAIWGPLVLTQIDREYVTGVITYDGRLRMVTCGHIPTADFLENVCEVLAGPTKMLAPKLRPVRGTP